ncbi:hypothetical protein ASPWEDRAFT_34063 [Aspergillus wentii DTO 134E9]|uniref:SET domain-containing protein n=1 Tax=Aspergillus wentii DTO 134E9 TaxID=1073089 RepID=A0A1L9S0D6_ASPWE|nr:uncharacterized protein ASPWEDRAFT_34063 [Aspergillus wentii DTO 134E9]KAI9931355.1 hypothetical protein MW887_011019 [Aspergillus wentii]OJJ40630.1 hypothetical protein ASPWEDRAFT_34063 [Aspergillus wentii DTO 134E9]
MDSSRTADSSLEAYTSLLEWMAQNGGHLHESVQIAKDEARGVHLQVRKDWKSEVTRDTHIIKTPLPATMSYFNAIDHHLPTDDASKPATFSAHGLHFPRVFMDAVGSEETSVFFLMGQYLRGSEGFWFPYIRTLPQPGSLTTPLYYEGEDLEWLNGTSLLPAREQKMKLFKDKYENGIEELRKAGVEDAEKYTWDLYLWASTIFVSRAFSSKVLSGVIGDADLPEDSVSVLLPFIDVLNHRPLAKVEWRAGEDSVDFVVLETVTAGHEIANNYGPRNNEQLMVNYGFCLPKNPCDYRIVNLRAPPGSPLYQAKAAQRQMYPELAKDADDHYYVFNVFYPLLTPDTSMENAIFSPALFNGVAVLAANDRELETLEISESGIRIPDLYGNSRTILAALSQIIIELITHIVKLKSSGQDLQHPQNLKQTHAKVYRDSQIMLSETALVVAAWTLTRARQHGFGGSWDETKSLLASHMARVPAGKFPGEIISRIQVRILERKSLLVNDGELFDLNDLFGILPGDMQENFKSCHQGISTQSSRAMPVLRGSPGSSPFAFPIFLCFVTAVYQNSKSSPENPQLPARLVKWVNLILENNPTPPDDVAWMLEDEDDEHMVSEFDEVLEDMKTRNQSVFSNIAQYTGEWKEDSWWLAPNWLRWAWMVMEQETVQVPDDPLKLLAAGGPGQGSVMLSTVSYLYIPQEPQQQ